MNITPHLMVRRPLQNKWDVLDWAWLCGVVTIAAILRAIFFSGFYGSDDTLYAKQALLIAHGSWVVSDYNGAIRYGINLPMAFFVKLFGSNLFSLALWGFMCSIGEVVLVFYTAHRFWGLRTAILSSFVISFLPIHIHYAGRFMADPPLAFFISLGILLFAVSEQRKSALGFFITGLVCGFIFWIKETNIVFMAFFAIYALIFRVWNRKWLWMILGAVAMVSANCLFLWRISGNPFLVFDAAVKIAHLNTGKLFDVGLINSSPLFYIKNLYFNGLDTWIMPFFAMGGLLLWGRDAIAGKDDWGTRFVAVCGLGLLVLFSLMVISLTPIRFIPKQTNYILILVAPFCLLTGYFLARLKGSLLLIALLSFALPSVLLAAMSQRSIQIFTGNSKATYLFANTHQNAYVYGGTNSIRVAEVLAIINDDGKNQIKPIAELFQSGIKNKPNDSGTPIYAIFDPQTIAMDA